MKSMLRNAGALLGLALLVGCATNRGYMTLATPEVGTVVGDKVVVIEAVSDGRKFVVDPPEPSTPSIKEGAKYELGAEELKRVIARKRNSYGMAIGDILLEGTDTVETVTRDLVGKAFAQRGYRVVDAAAAPADAPRVSVAIDEFWAWFSPGFWTVSMEAKVMTTLTVNAGGASRELTARGYGLNRAQSGREDNWRVAYDRAFADYLEKMGPVLQNAGY